MSEDNSDLKYKIFIHGVIERVKGNFWFLEFKILLHNIETFLSSNSFQALRKRYNKKKAESQPLYNHSVSFSKYTCECVEKEGVGLDSSGSGYRPVVGSREHDN
jgi:hypothetical protein